MVKKFKMWKMRISTVEASEMPATQDTNIPETAIARGCSARSFKRVEVLGEGRIEKEVGREYEAMHTYKHQERDPDLQ